MHESSRVARKQTDPTINLSLRSLNACGGVSADMDHILAKNGFI